MIVSRRRFSCAAALALAVNGLTACGDGGDPEATELSPTQPPMPSPPTAQEPTPGPAPAPGTPSALNAAVNSMAVNEFKLFKDSGWPTNLFAGDGSSTDPTLAFVHVGVRDPGRRKLFFVGAGYGPAWWSQYDEASDTWSRSSYGSLIHGWDHLAYDSSRGYFYYGGQSGQDQYRIDVGSGARTSAAAPWNSFVDTYGMEYWPALDSVLFADRNGTIYRRTNAGAVSTFASGGPSLGYDQALTYNPVRNVMYWGGGNGTETVFREVSQAGVITTLSNSPGIDCTRQKLVCGDQTGDAVLINFAAGTVSRYVHGSGWSSVPVSLPSAVVTSGPLTMAIPLHGFAGREVFMLVRCTGPSSAECYLYRYS